VAQSTHAGLPRLRFIRQRLGAQVHFWPFDGWGVPAGSSAIVEVYPRIWSGSFAPEGRTPDQQNAYSVARWLSVADDRGALAGFLYPVLTPSERTVRQGEGWILGVAGSPQDYWSHEVPKLAGVRRYGANVGRKTPVFQPLWRRDDPVAGAAFSVTA
jgi:hypothetical protein